MANEGWPRPKREKDAPVLVPGIRQNTGREPWGPLRIGTSPGVGVRARGVIVADADRRTDLGMDHIDRDVDAIGKRCLIPSHLIAEERGGRRRRDE